MAESVISVDIIDVALMRYNFFIPAPVYIEVNSKGRSSATDAMSTTWSTFCFLIMTKA